MTWQEAADAITAATNVAEVLRDVIFEGNNRESITYRAQIIIEQMVIVKKYLDDNQSKLTAKNVRR